MGKDTYDTLIARHAASRDDAIEHLIPREVASPSTVEQLSECLMQAHQGNEAVIIAGNRSKIEWGRPPDRLDLVINTSRLPSLIDHAASDLVVRVGASTGLDELQSVLAGANQRLAVDSVVPESSVGGLIATGISGPLRYGFGAVRDLIIGITVIRANGVRASSGGRVVKNVAGYDLAKLYTGSYGTLGAITEAYFRLHSLPEQSHYVLVELDLTNAEQALTVLLRAPLALSAVEIDYDTASAKVILGVLVEGRQQSVEVRSATAARLLGPNAEITGIRPEWWGSLPGSTTLKVSTEIAKLSPMLQSIGQIAQHYDQPLRAVGSAGVGVFFVGGDIPADSENQKAAAVVGAIRQASIGSGGSTVVVQAPAEIRAAVDVWGPIPALSVMRRVKKEFDPIGILAPGRFVGGI